MTSYRKTITAGAIVLKEVDGLLKLALAHDPEKGENKWVLPKGHIHTNESYQDTAIREAREEVGTHEIQLICYLGSLTRCSIEDWGETVEKEIHFYLAYAFGSPEIQPAEFETVVEAKWFSLSEALSLIPWQEDANFLRQRLAPMLLDFRAPSLKVRRG